MNNSGNRKKLTNAVKMQVLERHGGRCVNCGSTEELEFHHVVPLEIGGNDTEENIVPLCYYCHKAVTNHELLLRTAGRKHENGGRKRTIPENYEEILDQYLDCEMGKKELKRRLGLSDKNAVTDNDWYKEYLEKRGIRKFRNNVDLRISKSGINRGDPVGMIIYKDKTSKVICWKQNAVSREMGA